MSKGKTQDKIREEFPQRGMTSFKGIECSKQGKGIMN
jgi:hypothetical protein